jgi:chromate transporter
VSGEQLETKAGQVKRELGSPGSQASVIEVFLVALRLGLTSFGGPIAHLGYFHEEYVIRRKWLDERTYADLVALCQFLPGPASSQVGIAVGIHRAGLPGGFAAWLGFSLPSALALMLFAFGIDTLAEPARVGWLHGLKVVAVAVVAQAVWGMAASLCPDRQRASLAIVAAILTLVSANAGGQLIAIGVGGAIGWFFLPAASPAIQTQHQFAVRSRTGIIALAIFVALLLGLPLVRELAASKAVDLFDSFFRVGALVFGGGHVVLPLLQSEVVGRNWLTAEQFVAGYGAAQAVPGPLFTFAAYLGALMNGWRGALLGLAAIFLPAFLLVIGALPFWDRLRSKVRFQSALSGINAAVVGLLLAALYHPVWTIAIITPIDFALGLTAFGLLALWKWPPWLVVVLTAAAAEAVSRTANL